MCVCVKFPSDDHRLSVIRAGLRHVRGVQSNRAAKFRGAAILDPTKIKLPLNHR